MAETVQRMKTRTLLIEIFYNRKGDEKPGKESEQKYCRISTVRSRRECCPGGLGECLFVLTHVQTMSVNMELGLRK